MWLTRFTSSLSSSKTVPNWPEPSRSTPRTEPACHRCRISPSEFWTSGVAWSLESRRPTTTPAGPSTTKSTTTTCTTRTSTARCAENSTVSSRLPRPEKMRKNQGVRKAAKRSPSCQPTRQWQTRSFAVDKESSCRHATRLTS